MRRCHPLQNADELLVEDLGGQVAGESQHVDGKVPRVGRRRDPVATSSEQLVQHQEHPAAGRRFEYHRVGYDHAPTTFETDESLNLAGQRGASTDGSETGNCWSPTEMVD